ncbi:MAG: transposase [Gammaproteobacteria bacterium]|nr:transposase [Gammaproteobacteria bacterium]
MTYPLQFRQKVFLTKEKLSLTYQETSDRFDIPIRTLFRWQRQLEPVEKRNKPATKIDMAKLLAHVNDYPDAYLCERAEAFGVSLQAIFYALKRLGISYKKNENASKSQRAGTYNL